MLTCAFCESKPQYQDRRTGQLVCLEHSRFEVVAARPRIFDSSLTVRSATPLDSPAIRDLALHYWDETEVDCLDRQYDVLACPALLACDNTGAHEDVRTVVGLASYALEPDWDALVLVMLSILPKHQDRGGAWSLLDALRGVAQQQGAARMLVVTSNDDLPALALNQRYGYRIMEVLPGRIADHHGAEQPGFSSIPVRDEIRLVYHLDPEPAPAARDPT